MHEPRACLDCGRRWGARSASDYTALGLRLRRLARHRGVSAGWANPRPMHRCPTCTSRRVGADPGFAPSTLPRPAQQPPANPWVRPQAS